MARARKRSSDNTNGGNIGFEAELWAAADLLRGNIDPSEYKHVVLGLLFLKYVSDAFEERYTQLAEEAKADPDAFIDPEDPDEYTREAIFWLPTQARWQHLRDNARSTDIGKYIDEAMRAIEQANPKLKGVLAKDYARPALDKQRLGQLVDRLSNIGIGGAEQQSKDTLGRVYEYFLERFATAEGRRGGDFYTPRCVVQILVEMLEPKPNTRIFDPCCGTGGLFIQSEKFIASHGGKQRSAMIYGQEFNHTTWRLGKINLAARGLEAEILEGDSFLDDKHPALKADFVFANPPFNMTVWGGDQLREDVRWKYGTPPIGNANYAWIQHFIHHLSPVGYAGFVMANGSMSSNTSGEGDIRKAIVEADLVDCILALPGQLFYTTQIPVCLWFLARSKTAGKLRDRRSQTLFLDARKMGTLIDRVHRVLSDDEIQKIAGTYHAWRGEADAGKYEDVAGFCKSADLEEIRKHNHILTPGRYVGAAELEEDDEPFEEKMARLTATLREQFAESAKLEAAIRKNLEGLGYGERMDYV